MRDGGSRGAVKLPDNKIFPVCLPLQMVGHVGVMARRLQEVGGPAIVERGETTENRFTIIVCEEFGDVVRSVFVWVEGLKLAMTKHLGPDLVGLCEQAIWFRAGGQKMKVQWYGRKPAARITPFKGTDMGTGPCIRSSRRLK